MYVEEVEVRPVDNFVNGMEFRFGYPREIEEVIEFSYLISWFRVIELPM